MRIAITGATGFIGSHLTQRLLQRGDTITAFTRNASRARAQMPEGVELVEWTPQQAGPWQESLVGQDAVVHLAGKPVIDGRWTDSVKRELMASRVDSTRLIVEAIGGAPPESRPSVFVCASAVGYYGDRRDPVTEDAGPGDNYLSEICVAWEEGAAAVEAHDVRRVSLRIGVVLGEQGGALEKMLLSFKLFAGGHIGSGDQHMPWIHLDDTVGIILHAIDNADVRGPINTTAPNPPTMRDFSKAIGRAMGRPSWLPVPSFALKIAMGEASSALLTGQNTIPQKALDTGYTFQHPKLDEALRGLLG